MSTVRNKEIAENFSHLLTIFHQNFIQPLSIPLPLNHFGTLICLGNNGTQTIGELSSKLKISKQQMSPIIDKLHKSGYITREQDKTDRRSVNISITSEGYDLLSAHHDNIVHLFEQRLETISNINNLEEIRQAQIALIRLINKYF